MLSVWIASLGAVSYLVDERIDVGTSAVGFSASLVSPSGGGIQATNAVCRLEGAEIRYRLTGLVPTSNSIGQLLEVGDVLPLQGHDVLAKFLAIRTGSTNGILSCTYSTP